MTPLRLCRVEEVPEGGARGFRFGSGTDFRAVFLVKRQGRLYAYVNHCPHLGTTLDFQPDRFFDRDTGYLLCATHGARFRVEDGYCVDGPCSGKSLAKAAIRIDQGEITLLDEAQAPHP